MRCWLADSEAGVALAEKGIDAAFPPSGGGFPRNGARFPPPRQGIPFDFHPHRFYI
jgi:hypothetical protein